MSLTLGRLSSTELGKPVLHDQPSKTSSAVMSKLDELIDAIKALTAKLDADAGVTDTNYAALISNAISKVDLFV